MAWRHVRTLSGSVKRRRASSAHINPSRSRLHEPLAALLMRRGLRRRPRRFSNGSRSPRQRLVRRRKRLRSAPRLSRRSPRRWRQRRFSRLSARPPAARRRRIARRRPAHARSSALEKVVDRRCSAVIFGPARIRRLPRHLAQVRLDVAELVPQRRASAAPAKRLVVDQVGLLLLAAALLVLLLTLAPLLVLLYLRLQFPSILRLLPTLLYKLRVDVVG